MKKINLISIFWSVFASISMYGQDVILENFERKYSSDSLKLWIQNTIKEVSESHPGMYRYTSKSEFDTYTNELLQTINDSMTTIDYYRRLKPLFAKIGCLHTSVILSQPYREYYEEALKFIPIGIFIDSNKKVYITKNYGGTTTVPLKSELIAINEQPIMEVLNTLYKAIPSDGYNQTLKTLLLNHTFPLWYQSILSTSSKFNIEVAEDGHRKTYHVAGVSREELPSLGIEDTAPPPLEFEIKDGIGFLTIKSFSQSAIKDCGQNFKKFIKSAFKELNKHQIKDVIIDVRGNTGGSDKNAVYFATHLFDEPFSYWKHPVEVTEQMAKDFKTWYGIFFKRPKQVGATYQWKGTRWWLSTAFNYYKTQKPAKQNYKGNVYLLTDGGCMSSCSDVVAILSHNKKAIVVGAETGGGFQGNTSGMMPTISIQPNLTMTIPLQKYTNAVDTSKNIGRGAMPDYPIVLTLDDWMNENDIHIEYAKRLIKNKFY